MYTAFYGLREKPFQLSPDPRFLYLAQAHREALAHLLFGIEQGEGFIAVTGEVGTGKTTLCRALLQRLEKSAEVALIFQPQLPAPELLEAIHVELGLETAGLSQRQLMDRLNRFLLQKKQEGRRVLLVVDEAQNLGPDSLELIRMLSNLETDTAKLLQIVLLGQPEFDALLESPSLRQLRQRISVRWRLSPLSAAETAEYVRYRLRIAAGAPRELFSSAALREVHRRSGGIPRLVNLICDRALLAGYAAGARTIGTTLVARAERELRGGGRGRLRTSKERSRWPRRLLGAGALAALALLAFLGGRRFPAPLPWTSGDSVAPAQSETVAPARSQTVAAALAPEGPPSEAVAPLEPVPGPDVSPPETARPALAGGDEVDRVLAASDPGTSVARALDAALASWDATPSGARSLSLEAALVELRARGLTVQPVNEVDAGALAGLGHLALISLRASGGAQRSVLLRSVSDEAVWVVGLDEDGAALAMRRWDFDARVVGEAWILWRDFESLPEFIRPGQRGPGVDWLQGALRDLGLLTSPPSGIFDVATTRAVRAFQERRGLRVDGTVGPRTKMALYAALASYRFPRLARRSEEGMG